MSSTSRGCQPVRRFCRARILPRTTNNTNPTRYMSPYQRTARGPRWMATGSNCGWTSIGRIMTLPPRLPGAPPRSADRLARRGYELREACAAVGRPPREQHRQQRRILSQPAVDNAAAPHVAQRRRHQGNAKAGGYKTDDRLHLDRFLRDARREVAPPAEIDDRVVQACCGRTGK